ncbi:hypothetical protein ABZ832_28715 [Streptantibioticus parmotrematis]|uniref:hypothetical protein n=1 Tax=Streptantibioticus parmotrematis TaxID=2873249 RepID=UPI0033D0E504
MKGKLRSFRMLEARDKNNRTVYPHELTLDPPPFEKPLRCKGCEQKVSGVGAYFKGDGGPRPFRVRGHFRLPDCQEHEPHCRYNPTRVIEEIARGSAGLAEAEPDGRLRLVLPKDLGSSTPPPPTGPASPLGPGDDSDQASLRVTTVAPLLPPALNSAAKIVQFLQLHDFDPEALRWFRIAYDGKHHSWARFCYHPGVIPALYKRLLGEKPAPHPIAVYGVVQRAGISKKSGNSYVVLAANAPSGVAHRTVDVMLYSRHRTLLDTDTVLRPGVHVLAVGPWGAWNEQRPELRVWISEHWQLAHWTTDPTTGDPLPPRGPAPLDPAQRALAARMKPPLSSPGPRSSTKGAPAARRKKPPKKALPPRHRRLPPPPPARAGKGDPLVSKPPEGPAPSREPMGGQEPQPQPLAHPDPTPLALEAKPRPVIPPRPQQPPVVPRPPSPSAVPPADGSRQRGIWGLFGRLHRR